MKWKIKLNELKSEHMSHILTLRQRNINLYNYLNGVQIPQTESAKYLALYLYNKLNWETPCARRKAEQIRLKHNDKCTD